jgi:hypothetical protein
MLLTFGILVILSLIVFSVIFERRWREQQAAGRAGALAESTPLGLVNSLTSQMAEGVQQLRNSLDRKQEPQAVQAFAQWAATSLGHEPALQAWIAALPAPALQALVDQVATFCAEMNLNLAWLVEGRLGEEPVLQQAAHEIVVAYCSACWKAVAAQPEVQLFDTYQRLLQDPTNRRHRALSQQLYAQLIEQGLAAAPPPSDLVLASESQRQSYAIEAIQQAAQQNPQAFKATLKAVLLPANGETAPVGSP